MDRAPDRGSAPKADGPAQWFRFRLDIPVMLLALLVGYTAYALGRVTAPW